MKEKSLIIVRGIPGSGKDTFARLLCEHWSHVCTADEFMMEDGKYVWRPSKLGHAHTSCFNKAERLMYQNVKIIAVANTTTTERELKPYYELAKKHGYKVFSIIVENRHGGINEHEVPEESLEAMRKRFNIKL